jgi:hypothetical protein
MTNPHCSSCVEVSPLIFHHNHGALIPLVKISYNKTIWIAIILYYFCMPFGDVQYPLAMAELFSEPDADILLELSGTVHLCNPHESITVISITSIHSIVAMFPNTQINPLWDISLTGKFSLM